MCPTEYFRYCSSLLHFSPYYLSNNSWWGGYFLRAIWRKWDFCHRPIIQLGIHHQEASPHPVPLLLGHGYGKQASTRLLGLGFSAVKYTSKTPAFSPVSFLRFPMWLLIWKIQKAAPLPKEIMGCQAGKGWIYNSAIDNGSNHVLIASVYHALIARAFQGRRGRFHKQQGDALCIWECSAL